MNLGRLAYTLRTYRWLLQAWRLRRVPDYPIDRPIFLLGLQGGGLSLLSRMIRRHPDCVSVSGNSRYWTSSDEMANTLGLVLPAEFAGLRFKAPPHPVLTPPRSWTYASRDLLAQYRKDATDYSERLEKEFRRAIRFCAMLNAREPAECRFVDKSQTNCVRLGFLNSLLVDCDPRFVLLARDPYVSIYRAANGKAGDIKRLSDVLTYEERVRICTEHYFESMRAVYEDADGDSIPYCQERFEDLLDTPEDTLGRICDFVGLDFREDMLPQPQHRFPVGTRFKGRWWPLRPDVNSGYYESMEGWVIDYINAYDQDLIKRLGYEVIG